MKFKGFLTKMIVICCSVQISLALQPTEKPKEPKSLGEQAVPVVGKQIIKIYDTVFDEAQLERRYYEQVKKELLNELPWDLQLPVLKALTQSLEPFPLWIRLKENGIPTFVLQRNFSKTEGNMFKWLPPSSTAEKLQAIKPVRILLFELLADETISNAQKNDILPLLFNDEGRLFPGETAFTWVRNNVKDSENKKRIFEMLLAFTSQSNWSSPRLVTLLHLIVEAILGDSKSAIETFTKFIEESFTDPDIPSRLLQYLNTILSKNPPSISIVDFTIENGERRFTKRNVKVDMNKTIQLKNIVEGVQKTMAQAQKPIEVQEPMEQIEEPTEQQQSKRKKHME